MLFKHVQIVATPGALILAENGVNLLEYLERHLIPAMHEGVGNLMDELLTPIPVEMGDISLISATHERNNR